MKKNILLLGAALLFCTAPFFAAAQTIVEEIETGRFGAEEPLSGNSESGEKTYKDHWLFLGGRLGPSLRLYTPSGDTAFSGGDTYGWSLDAAIQASVLITPAFSIQAEVVFTWDNASVWKYALNPNNVDVDRYTQQFSGFSLQFPLTARLNFYPGKFRISPFLGGYFLLPLGEMKVDSSRDKEESFSYSVSPPFGLLGGLSAGFPLGSGMIFADIRYTADIAEPELRDNGIKTYRRHMVSFSIGYEFGLFKKGKTGSVK
jgi:hypothetical protein